MKKYRVNVNGTDYEITLEEVTGAEASKPSAPVAQPAPAAAPAPAEAPAAPAPTAAPAGGEQILSPMPGNILNVNVKVGDAVKKGQVLLILEAMKMENEIMAPKDGTITSVNVQNGSTVESGALLVTIG